MTMNQMPGKIKMIRFSLQSDQIIKGSKPDLVVFKRRIQSFNTIKHQKS